jgi:hypothetical protein
MAAKVFCITDCKFSGPYVRRSNNNLRDYIICDELTGDFGNGLEAMSICDFGSFSLFAGNWTQGILGFCNTICHADVSELNYGNAMLQRAKRTPAQLVGLEATNRRGPGPSLTNSFPWSSGR